MFEKPYAFQPIAGRTQVTECCGNSLCQGKIAYLVAFSFRNLTFLVEETPDN